MEVPYDQLINEGEGKSEFDSQINQFLIYQFLLEILLPQYSPLRSGPETVVSGNPFCGLRFVNGS